MESFQLNNHISVKAISKEGKLFFERQKNPPEKGGGTQGGLRLIKGLRLLNKEVLRYNVLTSQNAVIFPVQSFFSFF